MLLSKILTHSWMITQYIFEEKNFCYSLQTFRTAETLKHWNVILMNALKLMISKRLRCQKWWTCYTKKLWKENEVTIFDLCIFWKHISSRKKWRAKSKQVLYKQISDHVAYSYGSKLICIDDKFSQPFKSYLGEDAVCNFVNNTVEESKYCSEVMHGPFNKELVITKKDDEDFKNSNKCYIFQKFFV